MRFFGFFLLLFTVLLGTSARAQTADSLARRGIALMDAGDYTGAITSLEAAKEKEDKPAYDYEIGLALYKSGDYRGARKVFNRLVKKQGDNPQYYQMLGNTTDMAGNAKKALKIYRRGIEKFPEAGTLYLESGVVHAQANELTEALNFWERGIVAAPTYPSNYYWATKVFAESNERVWALLYAEMFLNLEFYGPRAEEISELLYNTYGEIYTAESDTSGRFKLTKNGFTIHLDPGMLTAAENGATLRLLPFEGDYAMAFAPAAVHYLNGALVDAHTISAIRGTFLESWYGGDSPAADRYDHALLAFQKEIADKGWLAHYDRVLFRMANPTEFEHYSQEHQEEMDAFIEWYEQHNLPFEKYPHGRLEY